MADIVPGDPHLRRRVLVDSDLPLICKLTLNGYPVLYPRVLAKRVNATAPVCGRAVAATATALATCFPPF